MTKRGELFAEYRRAGIGAQFKSPAWKGEGVTFHQTLLHFPETFLWKRECWSYRYCLGSL